MRAPSGACIAEVRRTLEGLPNGVTRAMPVGKALLKAILKGGVGTQSLDVVPPNTGTDGGLVPSINNGPCATIEGTVR